MPRILLITFTLFLFSCESQQTKKPVDTQKPATTASGDTASLFAKVKSYEPVKYKGKVPEDFYIFYGMHDWWRFPLVYPYSILCIDVIENGGTIVDDSGIKDLRAGGSRHSLTEYFDQFIFDKNYFIGNSINSPFNKSAPPLVEQYYLLSFSNGKLTAISGRSNLDKKLQEIRFGSDTVFITIREYYRKLKL